MASTNKTTNYELSQYVGTDKPTYLSDYNGDMYKIDAQMKVNADNVATAISSAQSATTTANQANTTANQANTTANSANTTANSASTTATNAQTTANSALSTATTAQASANEANTKIDNFNLTQFTTVAVSDMSKTGNATINSSNVSVAMNEDGSLAKVYGELNVTPNGQGNIIIPTDLRPEEELTINGVVIRAIINSSTVKAFGNVSMVIKTNGNIEVPYTYAVSSSADNCRFIFTACLLFVKQFGDTPIPDNN